MLNTKATPDQYVQPKAMNRIFIFAHSIQIKVHQFENIITCVNTIRWYEKFID